MTACAMLATLEMVSPVKVSHNQIHGKLAITFTDIC